MSTTSSAERAEIYLRLIAEAELRHRPVISGPGPQPHRVWLAAATLAAVGAVGPDVAWQVVSEFETSAGLRGGDAVPVISSVHPPHWARQTRAGQHRTRPQRARQHRGQPGGGGPGGGGPGGGPPGTGPAGDEPDAPSAIQIGATLPLPPEQEGWYGEFCLLGLARTESQAALAVAARWAGQTRRTAGPRPRHAPYHQVGAVDDRGVSYRAALWDMGVEDGRDWWDCHLGLDPAPPPATRWRRGRAVRGRPAGDRRSLVRAGRIAIVRRRRDTARDGQRLGAPGSWLADARQRPGRHRAGHLAVLAGPRLHRPLASGQRHELGGGLADQGNDQDVPDSPGAPGGHGPRGVRDRASPSGPGDGPAQVGRGRLPAGQPGAPGGLPHPPPATGPGQ